ncbi:MAG: G-D-S-L family lipolytic protein [Hymenobacter sp.]|nr:G-D-S-L family lipolytic protein [Hymenobacter sp.]
MKRITGIALGLVALFFLLSMRPLKPKKVIFFGDSITAQGVNPDGYIALTRKRLETENKASEYELVGAGVSGNKIYDLYFRLDADVLSKQPDVVVIYIGVNDVWHKMQSGTGTDAGRFAKFYAAIIEKTQAAKAKVILCTPAVIGERKDNTNEQDGDLNQYSQVVRELAAKYKCPLVDLRKQFQEYEAQHNPQNEEKGILTRDKVHLNPTGNQFVADLLFSVITS